MNRRNSESGQTLIVIMFVMLVMVIAGIFLVDLQSMIRGKIKSQSAVDSAALVGAEWQKHTLNMIGELNLIKASTVLLSGYANSPTYNEVTFLDVRMAELSNITLTQYQPEPDPPIYTALSKSPLISNSHGEDELGFAELDFGYGNQGYYMENDDDQQWHWHGGAYPLRGKDLIYSMADRSQDEISFTIGSAGVVYIAVQTNIGGSSYILYTEDNEGNVLSPNAGGANPWEYISGADIWLRLYEASGAEVLDDKGETINDGFTVYRRYFGSDEVGKRITLDPNTSHMPVILTLQDVQEIPQGMKDELRSVAFAADRISNMQARVSFVGPLIGFGAAQQAAKNNGLPNNEEYTEVVQDQFLRLRDGHEYTTASGIMQTIPYRDPLTEKFPYDYDHRNMGDPGYGWRGDYWTMLEPIVDNGIAVAPNTRFLGIPDMDGNTWFVQHGYATDEEIYNAVIAEDWCVLRHVLRNSFGSTWWGTITVNLNNNNFVQESEYLPVGIIFNAFASTEFDPDHVDSKTHYVDPMLTDNNRTFTSIRSEYDMSQPYEHGDNEHGEFDQYPSPDNDGDGKYDPIPYIEFAVFDHTWWPYHEDWIADWETYTDKQFIEGMDYWGGTVRMSSELEMDLLSGHLTPQADDPDAQTFLGDALEEGFSDSDMDLGNGTDARREVSFDDVAGDVRSSEQRMRDLAPKIEVSSAAKAFGQFNLNGVVAQPIVAGMVLPVFNSVALIPVALEDPGGLDPFDVDFYRWVSEGLPILGQHNNLGAAAAELRAHEHWSSFSTYFGAIQTLNDPAFRERGLAWLDAPVGYDADGNVISDNEDSCTWTQGGGGSHHGGPSKLH